MAPNKLDEQAKIGLDGMDREHALELALLRTLADALAAGDRSRCQALLGQLEDLTNAHFLAEQLLMRLHGYPGYAAHQMEHDQLMDELRTITARIQSHPSPDASAEVAALERW